MAQTLKTLIPLAVVFSLLVATNFLYAGWTAPSGAPSEGSNTLPPINEGATNQIKEGDITALQLKAGGQVWSDWYCNATGTECASHAELYGLTQ